MQVIAGALLPWRKEEEKKNNDSKLKSYLINYFEWFWGKAAVPKAMTRNRIKMMRRLIHRDTLLWNYHLKVVRTATNLTTSKSRLGTSELWLSLASGHYGITDSDLIIMAQASRNNSSARIRLGTISRNLDFISRWLSQSTSALRPATHDRLGVLKFRLNYLMFRNRSHVEKLIVNSNFFYHIFDNYDNSNFIPHD